VSPLDLGLVLVSAFLHALWSASIKGSRDPLTFSAMQQVTSVIGIPILALGCDLGEVPPAVWPLLAATGVMHAVYLYWMNRAYERADLTVVYPIVRSTPALLPFLAIAWLGESVSVGGALGIAVTVLGVWLVHTQGDVSRAAFVTPGASFAYLSLLATVGYSLLDKRAMALLEPAPWSGPLPRSITYFFLIGIAHSVFFLPLAMRRIPRTTWRTLRASEWGVALLATLISLGSYGLILEAYRRAPASYVVAVRQVSVLFAVGIAALWLRERPSRPRVIGAAATVGGVALIALFP
jgi:drug/metabolite transporter (DMT)-like permease